MSDFSDYTLGESATPLTLATRQENTDATLELVKQCKLKLAIISRELDPFIYDQSAFIEAVKKLALRGRHVEIRIIVFKSELLIRKGHRLLNLANQLSSFMALRKPDRKDNTFNQAMMIVDDVGYVLREDSERYKAEVQFNDRRQTRNLLLVFNKIWDMAKPDPNLRRMHL